ncbi:MAG: helix-hairpin-helix domain-containing protein [Neisseria sp.]|nr:helix-hairpin-helix domain-containing protein [Neisseria sp.]
MKKIIFALLAVFSMTWLFAAVNINTASEQELATLRGVGSVKAAAIVEYRKQNGPFKSKEELKSVKGIGEKTYDQLENEITVGTVSAPPKKEAIRATGKK